MFKDQLKNYLDVRNTVKCFYMILTAIKLRSLFHDYLFIKVWLLQVIKQQSCFID